MPRGPRAPVVFGAAASGAAAIRKADVYREEN